MRRSSLVRSLLACAFVLACSSSVDSGSSTSTGSSAQNTGGYATGSSATGATGTTPGASGGADSSSADSDGSSLGSGGLTEGSGGADSPAGGSDATGGAPLNPDAGIGANEMNTSGGFDAGGGTTPAAGGAVPGGGGSSMATGGWGVSSGGRAFGGWNGASGGSSGTGSSAGSGGVPTGDGGVAGAGTGGADSECPSLGNVTYRLNVPASPSPDVAEAYSRIDEAMSEAVRYYNCYTHIELQITANYKPEIDTAEGNIDGLISFGKSAYMTVRTAMHEIAHVAGIGYYTFGQMTDSNGIWTGAVANAVLASIPNPRDTQLHADKMHFWPYGLNYESEYENEDDLINHCKLVQAIRQDMGLDD